MRYSGALALRDATLDVRKNAVTAFIGPSGCGKSTFIRCFNRMNDLIPGARDRGQVLYHGRDLYAPEVDPVEVRRRIGMVFQKPNPFPKSIYDNIAFGPRVLGMKKDLDERVERALAHAALWDEVKDRLKENALGLSGGQQQRLCIARALAVEPDVILMDEPASALDPISTTRIEDLIHELKRDYTIVIVTHNMQQAARVADMTAFFSVEVREDGRAATASSSSTTRRRRSSRTRPTSAPRTTSRGGSDERWPSVEFHEPRRARGELPGAGRGRPRARCAARSTRCRRRTSSSATRSIAFDDEIDDALPRDREADRARARAADAGRDRPAARARDPAHVDPPRAHRRPVRDDRQADEALEPARAEATTSSTAWSTWASAARRWCVSRSTRSQQRDVERARPLARARRARRPANRQVFDEVLGYVQRRRALEWGMRQIAVARCFERIGDNAVDIGEQTAFLVTGEFREFTDASH